MFRFAIVVLPTLIIASAHHADAWTQPQQQLPTCNVSVPVTTIDGKGNIRVGELNASDLHVRIGGREVTPTISKDRAQHLTILVDVSGSMREAWPVVLPTTRQLLAQVPRDQRFSLYLFGEKIHRADSHVSADELLGEFADPKKVTGKTGFYAAMIRALSDEPREPGDAMLILSDGAENMKEGNLDHVRRLLRDRGVRLYVFAYPPERPMVIEDVIASPTLVEFTGTSGGWMWVMERKLRKANLGDTIVNPGIVASLLTYSRLELAIPNRRKAQKLKIEWSFKKKKKALPNLVAPAYVRPCEP